MIKSAKQTCDDQEVNDELNTTKETPKLVPSSSLLRATLQNSSSPAAEELKEEQIEVGQKQE